MPSLNGNDRTIPLPVANGDSAGCGCSSEPKRTVDARKGVAWWRSLGEREQSNLKLQRLLQLK